MLAYKIFENYFSVSNLEEIYHSSIKPKASVGIDRINRSSFENKLLVNLKIINRKVLDGTYELTLYKEKLISKGRGKIPRVLSIPTIRDKVALKALNNLLFDVFKSDINNQIVQTTIDILKKGLAGNKYDYFLKYDITNFYPSIEHDRLLRMVRRKIRKDEIIRLLESSITTKTVPHPNANIQKPKKGIPQGLSISNVLASIYFMDIDKKFESINDCLYMRYVDDILILTKKENYQKLNNELEKSVKEIGLTLNKDKQEKGLKEKQFDFLGYKNTDDGLTVRDKSIESLRESILKIIAQFKHSNNQSFKRLEWSLNMRITGCIYKEKKYGWLFFFSQIDDLKLLYHLDWFVNKMLLRFEIEEEKLQLKKFIRTYHEITKNLSSTNYIPNFSNLDYNQQREILTDVFDVEDIASMSDLEVDQYFSRLIFRTIRELEQDIQTFS
ncbi:MAG: reverse transcriptase domain-containing protein [Candidatus Paceibacterota bacterium]